MRPSRRRRATLFGGAGRAAMLLLAACTDGERESDADVRPAAPPCGPGGLLLDDGRCLAAGTRDNGCAAGEDLADGTCLPAGVPPGKCGAGFEPDGEGGCDAVLPS